MKIFTKNDEIYITMGEEDWQEVYINKQLHLHITSHKDGFCIDFFKYKEPGDVDDDFDDLFIGSRYFLWDDLQ